MWTSSASTASLGIPLLLQILGVARAAPGAPSNCRVLPGDDDWPSAEDWEALNRTVGGRLIATVPVASVCHTDTTGPYSGRFNETECGWLKLGWNFPQAHFPFPADVSFPWQQNQTCDPYTPPERPCELGNYASYSVNVSSAADVAAGIRFAKERNVRLVIKNTGHDYLGKSTGRGALSLWTHNLKTLQFIPSYSPNSTLQLYPAGASANATSSATWTGPALRMGAGVQAFEAYLYAASLGLRVVGGTCPTVGLAGGYTQGGGHSTLSGIYGLGADNVLEWEVVTAAGEHVVARPGDEKTGDLYWALSGGGAGTYAVVLSATVRLHPDGPVTGAYMTFDDTTVAVPNGSNEITANDAFWDAVGAFQALLPPILATGTTLLYSITEHTFNMFSLTAPGHSVDDVAKLLAPVFKELDGRGVRYKFTSHTSPNFITHFATDFGPLPFGYFSSGQLTGSRLVPRSLLRPDTSNSAALATLIAAQRNTTRGDDFFLACQALDVGSMENKILLQPAAGNPRSPGIAPNAVLPAWRDAASHCIVVGPWDYNVTTPPLAPTQLGHPMRAKMDRLTDVISPQLEAATPGSGTYLNEANVKQHDWQKHFYGANFQRLRGIKDRWDPTAVFYAPTAVGSEDWEVDGSGRLCRVAAGGSVVSA